MDTRPNGRIIIPLGPKGHQQYADADGMAEDLATAKDIVETPSNVSAGSGDAYVESRSFLMR